MDSNKQHDAHNKRDVVYLGYLQLVLKQERWLSAHIELTKLLMTPLNARVRAYSVLFEQLEGTTWRVPC